MRQVEAPNLAHASCDKDIVHPPSASPCPPASYAPNMPAPRPRPEMGGIGEASDTPEVDSAILTKTPENGIPSRCHLPSPRSPPGPSGCFQNTRLPELTAEPRGGAWRPHVKVEELKWRKRRVTSLVSGSAGHSAFLDEGTPSVVTPRQGSHLTGPEVRIQRPASAAAAKLPAIRERLCYDITWR